MALAINNCCFCLKLRTGSLIFGYLNLIGNLIITPFLVFYVCVAIAYDAKFELIIASVMTIFFIIHLILNIALLVGLHKRKRGPLNAYLIYTIFFIVMVVIICSIMAGSPDEVIGILVYIVLSIYSLVVIWSYSLKMDDASRKPDIYNTARDRNNDEKFVKILRTGSIARSSIDLVVSLMGFTFLIIFIVSGPPRTFIYVSSIVMAVALILHFISNIFLLAGLLKVECVWPWFMGAHFIYDAVMKIGLFVFLCVFIQQVMMNQLTTMNSLLITLTNKISNSLILK